MALCYFPDGDVSVVNAEGETLLRCGGRFAEADAIIAAERMGCTKEKTGETLSEKMDRLNKLKEFPRLDGEGLGEYIYRMERLDKLKKS